MSKQLAISSTFSIFAMACLVLLSTPNNSLPSQAGSFMPVQAETLNLDLPAPNLLP